MASRRRQERRQPVAGNGAASDPTYLVGVGVDGVIVGEKTHLGVEQPTGKIHVGEELFGRGTLPTEAPRPAVPGSVHCSPVLIPLCMAPDGASLRFGILGL